MQKITHDLSFIHVLSLIYFFLFWFSFHMFAYIFSFRFIWFGPVEHVYVQRILYKLDLCNVYIALMRLSLFIVLFCFYSNFLFIHSVFFTLFPRNKKKLLCTTYTRDVFIYSSDLFKYTVMWEKAGYVNVCIFWRMNLKLYRY